MGVLLTAVGVIGALILGLGLGVTALLAVLVAVAGSLVTGVPVVRMVPVGFALQIVWASVLGSVLEPLGVGPSSLGIAVAGTLLATGIAAATAIRWLHSGTRLLLTTKSDVVVAAGSLLGGLALMRVAWRSPAQVVSWASAGGDFVAHNWIVTVLLSRGRSLHLEAGFAGGYPHHLHTWVASVLVLSRNPSSGEILLTVTLIELVMYCLTAMCLSAAAVFVLRRMGGLHGAIVGVAVVQVLLLGRPFIQYTVLTGFFSTVGGAFLLGCCLLVLLTVRNPLHQLVLQSAFTAVLAGTWLIVAFVPGVLALLAVVRLARSGRAALLRLVPLSPVFLMLGIAAALPFVAAYRAGAQTQIGASGATFPLPANVGLFGCALIIAGALTLTSIPLDVRIRLCLAAGALIAAATVISLALGGLDDAGQLQYYPKKIAWYGYAMTVPIAAVIVSLAVLGLVRYYSPGLPRSVVIAGCVGGMVLAGQYSQYYAPLDAMASGTAGVTVETAAHFLSALGRSGLTTNADSEATMVIGPPKWMDQRQLSGLAGAVTASAAPFDANIFANDPEATARCELLRSYGRRTVVVLNVTPGQAVPACVTALPDVRVIDAE